MTESIICPQCQFEFEITEVLSAQLRSQLQNEYQAEIRKEKGELDEREKLLVRAEQQLAKSQEDIDRRVAEQLVAERKQIVEQAQANARQQLTLELRDKDDQLAAAFANLKTAQESELAIRKERRELQEAQEALQLTLTRRLDEERARIREAAKKEAIDERQFKDAEKDKLIGDLRKQIDDLKRKSEQGSQQLQGEVLEMALEELLRQHFPFDDISPVAKGVHGGDVVQTVRDPVGTVCGAILWESKRTKNWSDSWLPKLRDDQRAAKAQVALLVTAELPRDVANFRHVDGVWVTSVPCAIGLAHALRAGMLEVAAAKRSLVGQHDKMEVLYNYFSGAEFRHRVEGIVEAFVTLRDDLEAEKRATQRIWAKREKQLERAVMQTAGMYGDLSGIIGGALPMIASLDFPPAALLPEDPQTENPSSAASEGHDA